MVLGSLHQFALAGTLVVDAAKVQDAVDDDAVQFFIIILFKQFGIGANGVQRDDQVAVQGVALVVIESDDVGVVVVTQVLTVHRQDVLVVTEQVTHLADLLAVGGCHTANPRRGFASFDIGELNSFRAISNHRINLQLDYLLIDLGRFDL